MTRAAIRGVTRFELILGTSAVVLVTSLIVALTQGTEAKKSDTAAVTARRLVTAAADWKREHAELGCPTVSQLIFDQAWQRSEPADDPWGSRYRIHCSTGEVHVRSAGGDGQFETEDDIAVDAPWNS